MNPCAIPSFVARGIGQAIVGTLETIVAVTELVAMYRSFTASKLIQ